MRADAVGIAEETNMAQHIHFIKADGLHRHHLFDLRNVFIARGNHCNAGAREGNFGGRCEDICHIFFAGLAQRFEQIFEMVSFIVIQMMNGICIIPENTEIRRSGRERRKAVHHLVAVGKAVRVGILRNAPNSFDRRVVVDILLNHIHIRPLRGHGNVDHLNAERFTDRKMTVISGGGAQKPHFFKMRPGLGAEHAVQHIARHGIIHDIKA